MSENDTSIEKNIVAAGKTAPCVTPADIKANIISECYFTAYDGVAESEDCTNRSLEVVQHLKLLTFCVLVLKNGFTVTGESACASPENFDPEIGRKIARENAEQKIWPLMGYQLKEQLYQSTRPGQVPRATAPADHLEAAAVHVSAANSLLAAT